MTCCTISGSSLPSSCHHFGVPSMEQHQLANAEPCAYYEPCTNHRPIYTRIDVCTVLAGVIVKGACDLPAIGHNSLHVLAAMAANGAMNNIPGRHRHEIPPKPIAFKQGAVKRQRVWLQRLRLAFCLLQSRRCSCLATQPDLIDSSAAALNIGQGIRQIASCKMVLLILNSRRMACWL